MGDTNDSILSENLNDNILNSASSPKGSNDNLNNLSSQAKIVDYYKPKYSKKEEKSITSREFGKPSLIGHKAKNETRSILEDVCTEFENIEVTTSKNGPTSQIIHHSTPISATASSEEQDQGSMIPREDLTAKENNSQLVPADASEEFQMTNNQDDYVLKVVFPTELEKFRTLPLQRSSQEDQYISLVDLPLPSASCSIATTLANNDILLESDHIVNVNKKIYGISPHISSIGADDNECENTASSFTVSDNVEAFKISDGQSIDFGEYEISGEYSVHEDFNTESVGDDTGQSSEETESKNMVQNSCDYSESDDASSKPAIQQDPNENVHTSPYVRNAKARRISAALKRQWAKEIAASGHLICPMRGCYQKYVTVANFQTHYKWCTGKKTLQHCPHCNSLIFTGAEAVLQHMMVEHPERVDEYKEKCASEVASLPDEAKNITVVKSCKVKAVKKRGFSSKENNLVRKNSFKKELKPVETMDENFMKFKKCVRFNDVVEKINSLTDGVNAEEKLKNPRTFSRLPKHRRKLHCYENEAVNGIHSFDDEEEENVDCPSHDMDEKPHRRVTTKSRIVLNTQGYKRFNEYLKLTRDWASERKTYSRSRSADSSCFNSSDTSSIMTDVEDTFQLNEPSMSTAISLSDQGEYSKGQIALETSLVGLSIKKEVPNKSAAKANSLNDTQMTPTIKATVQAELPVSVNATIEDKPKIMLKSGLKNTHAPAEEVSYGHLVFAQPSKISKKVHATCYDNVVRKSIVDCKKSFKFDRKVRKNFFQEQKSKVKGKENKKKRKRGRPPKNLQQLTSEKLPPLNAVEHSKEAGVKLPTDLNPVKKRRGRPPKYFKGERPVKISVKDVSKTKANKEAGKKIMHSTPIVFNQSINISYNVDSKSFIAAEDLDNSMKSKEIKEAHLSNEKNVLNSSLVIQNGLPHYNTAIHDGTKLKVVQSSEELVATKQLSNEPEALCKDGTKLKIVPKLQKLAMAALKSNPIFNSRPPSNVIVKDIFASKHFKDVSFASGVSIDKISTGGNDYKESVRNDALKKSENLLYSQVSTMQATQTINNSHCDICEAEDLNDIKKQISAFVNEIVAAVSIKDTPSVQNCSSETNLTPDKSTLMPTLKKKRGRPPKGLKTIEKPSNTSTCSAMSSSTEEFVIKRKRGRPRKNPQPELLGCQQNSQNSAISNQNINSQDRASSENQDTKNSVSEQKSNHSSSNEMHVKHAESTIIPGDTTCDALKNSYSKTVVGCSILKMSSIPVLDESAKTVRRSLRDRKRKSDADMVFLQPKKNSRGDGIHPQTHDQIVKKIERRGRPRKIKVQDLQLAIVPEPCCNGDKLLNTHVSVPDGRKKSSRKGRPRKCIQNVELDSETEPDDHERETLNFLPNGRSILDMRNTLVQDTSTGHCDKKSADCILENVKEDSMNSRDVNCTNSQSSAMNRDAVSVYVDDASQVPQLSSFNEKSTGLFKRKLGRNIIRKYKLINIRHRNKIKLHKIHHACQATRDGKNEAVPENSEVVSDCQSMSPTHRQNGAAQKPELRKTRQAAIKARRLLGDILHSDNTFRKSNKEEKGVDFDFIPDAEDDTESAGELLKSDVEEQWLKYKQYIECPKFVKPVASKTIIAGFIQELEQCGKIVCKTEGCAKTLSTLPGMIYHYEIACPKKHYSWKCRFCEQKFKPNSLILLRHMETIHFPSEKRQSSRNFIKRDASLKYSSHEEDILPHVKKFFELSKKTELMGAVKPEISSWQLSKSCEEFVPESKTSIMMKIESISNKKESPSSWFQLPYFKSSFGKTDNGHVLLYAGGRISCCAWCPTPHGSEVTQYLCLATSKFESCKEVCTGDETEKGLLQLWNVGTLSNSKLNQPPALDLAIVHKHGRIRAMAWCPQGCYEYPNTSTKDPEERFPRLGLLAVACKDSTIRVYSVPHPQYLKRASENLPFYAAEPAILLKSRYGGRCLVTQKAACTSVCWQRSNDMGIVMGGFSNGLVSLWDISACDRTQNHCVNPYLTFQAHEAAVTSLSFAPFSDQQYAATGSLTRMLRIWNLSETTYPTQEYKIGSIKSIHWPLIWSGVFLSLDDGTNTKGFTYKDLGTIQSFRSISNNANTSEWTSDVSEWLNASIVGDAFGSITISSLQQLNTSRSTHRKFPTSYPIIHTEVVRMNEENSQERSPNVLTQDLPSSENMQGSDEKHLAFMDAHTNTHGSSEALLANSHSSVFCASSKCSRNPSLGNSVLASTSHDADASCRCVCMDANGEDVSSAENTAPSAKFGVNMANVKDLNKSRDLSPSDNDKAPENDEKPKHFSTALSSDNREPKPEDYGLKFITKDLTNIQNVGEMTNFYTTDKSSVSSCHGGLHPASTNAIYSEFTVSQIPGDGLKTLSYRKFDLSFDVDWICIKHKLLIVLWNPNYGAHNWLFVVNDSGIGQLVNIGGLKFKDRTQKK